METIEMLLENYATSINNGDLDLADKLFLQNENTSFIHPRGHEVGFDNVKEAFYVKTMINRFSKRDLRIHNIKINLLTDNTAVVEFYWEKDGVYQPILDDAAWSEVKSVIIDIIKSNVEVDGVI